MNSVKSDSPGQATKRRYQAKTLDQESPIKVWGGFFDIFRDLFWGPKNKYRISLCLRAISWDPLENRPGANWETKTQQAVVRLLSFSLSLSLFLTPQVLISVQSA